MIRLKNYLKKYTPINLLAAVRRSISNIPPAIKGRNNKLINEGVFNQVSIDIIGNNNLIRIGKNTTINKTLIYIRGDHHVIDIAANCFFGEGELWIEDHHGSIIIHTNTTIQSGHLAVTEPYSKLEIMENCMLAKSIEIRTGDSHSIIDLASGERINKAANITLEEHVWIGAHAKILKGVTIGHNSVIATAAVVTKNIPHHCIAGGIPARVIRSAIDWKMDRL